MEMKFGAKFENTVFWKALKALVEWLMIICSVGCSGVIIIATIMRYCFTKNWYGSDEIILMFAFWLYFMGAVYGSYEDSHIKADIVASLERNIRKKDILSLLAQVVLVVVNFVLITWAVPYLTDAIIRMPATTALKIPLFIPRIAILLGLILMEFYHVYYLIKNFVNFRRFGYFSTPNEYDYFPKSLMAKYPNTGLLDHDAMEAKRAADAAAYEEATNHHDRKEEK